MMNIYRIHTHCISRKELIITETSIQNMKILMQIEKEVSIHINNPNQPKHPQILTVELKLMTSI